MDKLFLGIAISVLVSGCVNPKKYTTANVQITNPATDNTQNKVVNDGNLESKSEKNEVSTIQRKDDFIKDCVGNCFDGKGTLNFSDGSQYVGEFHNGIINGKGKLTLGNGDAYIGKFKNGLVDGKATAIYADGGKYVGEFKNNKMHGNGMLILPNGTKYSGKFKDGVPVIPVKKTLSESDAKNAVLKILKDPDSAKFGRFEQITNTGACLAVNAKNSYGGYTGEQQAFLIKKDAFNWVVIELSEVSYEMCIDFFKNRE